MGCTDFVRLYSEFLENFHLLDVGKYFQRPTWPKGEGFDLSVGQPDFDVSRRIKDTAARAILEEPGGYVSAYGMLDLREKCAQAFEKRHQIAVLPDQVVVTPGSSAALFIAMRVLVSPGDEVIIFDPYFPGYKACAELVGAKAVFVKTGSDFIPNPDDLERAITKKTKLIIINTPNNPSGAVYPESVMRRLAEIAKKHDIFILSDEVYEEFVYEGSHVGCASFYDRVITLKSFSKTYAMTGWRVGYAVGPLEIIRMIALVNQYLFACIPPFVQRAALSALDLDVRHHVEQYRNKRNMIWDGLKDHFSLVKPSGAYYALVKTPIEEQTFVKRLLEEKIVVFPGSMFSEQPGSIRLSFAVPDDRLRGAISLLQKLNY